MRAVGIMVHGGPEALEVVELPEVHAGPGHVRVRIHAAAVNPTETIARNGSRAEQQKVDPPPYVPGMDAAGIVDAVGPGVTTGVKVGTPSWPWWSRRAATGRTANRSSCMRVRWSQRQRAPRTSRRARSP